MSTAARSSSPDEFKHIFMRALKTQLIRYPHLNTKRCLHTDSAQAIVASGDADLVAFGRHFSSNPDLPYRLKHKLPLTPYVRAAFGAAMKSITRISPLICLL
jgi:2,4-dienoyl-CoA reductase-like NADH-dependent reductase (Old Yellow Enzyme family)